MDADIVMFPEYDAGDVDCNVEACYPCWRWLSRLGRSRRNANGGLADVNVTSPKKRKAVTFCLEWNEQIEAALCPRCRDHMQKHYHGELCRRCGAQFTIIDLGRGGPSTSSMEWRMEHQAPFLKSVLQEANQHKRQELLRMANADQINAISELVMNTLRGTVPRSRHTITLLKPHAQSLRAMAKPAHSVKRRRAIMMAQKGGTLWPELYRCYKRCMR